MLRRSQSWGRDYERRRHNDKVGGCTNRAAAQAAPSDVAGDDPGDDNEREQIEGQVKFDPVIGDKALEKALNRLYRRKPVRVLHGTKSLSFDDYTRVALTLGF